MDTLTCDSSPEQIMRAAFEARLPLRIERAGRIKLQHLIPEHWFAAAASECATMFIDGHFYGSISVAQAYIEALSRFLAEHHKVRVGKDVEQRCRRLADAGVISEAALNAARNVLEQRNDFHHLNKDVPGDYETLQQRAEDCINELHTIESEVFAYLFDPPGALLLKNPQYWPDSSPGMARVHLRNLL